MSEQKYPADEFDVAEGTRPRGVHRAPEPWWRWLLPFLVVLVVVPALAWGLMYLLSPATPEALKPANPSPVATVSTPDSANPAEGEKPAESAEAQPNDTQPSDTQPNDAPPSAEDTDNSDQAKPEDSVQKDVNVRVLNGAGKQGLAGKTADALKAAGYTKNAAENARGWASKVSAVYYPTDDLKATAEDIAKRLKIGVVKANPRGKKDEIVVLLRKDVL